MHNKGAVAVCLGVSYIIGVQWTVCVSNARCGRFAGVLMNATYHRFILSLIWFCVARYVCTTGAVPAVKPEVTTIGDPQDGRWKITLMFDGRRFCILQFRYSTLQQMTCQWRHWWFPTTSCFGVTNHSEAASLWLVTRDRATINSGSPPSCGATFWQWSVASPSEMGWLASKVSRYLSILCLWVSAYCLQCFDAVGWAAGRASGL